MGNCNCGRSNKSSKFDSTILTEEEIRFLLSNTKLTREQINALHYNFLEECPAGKMTKKDFSKLFKKVHQTDNKKEKSDKFCDYVFKVIDADNRGYISFKDFVLCLSLTSYGDFKQKCEFAFRLYDQDKDGKISKKEMAQVLESLYDLSGIVDRKGDKAPAKKVEEIINKLNKNNTISSASSNNLVSSRNKTNDYITKEQFMDGCLNDKNIKNLFIDSIFAKATHDDEKNHNINNNKDLLIGETPKLCFLCIFKVTPLKAPEYTVSDMKKVTDTKLKSSSFNYVEKKPSFIRHEPNVNVTEFRPNNGYDLVLKVSESEAYQLADKYSSLNRDSSIQTYEIINKEPKFENLEHIQSQSIILDQVHNFTVNENIIHHLENQNNITDYQETYEGYYNIENIPKIEQNQNKNQADNIYLLLDERETFQFVDKIISESGIKANYETDEITTHNIDITLSPNIDDLKYQINDNELTESDKQLINNFINEIEKYNDDDLTGSVIVETASSNYFEPISGEHVNISETTTNVLIDIKFTENENIILLNNHYKNIDDSNEPEKNFTTKQIDEQIQNRKISEEQKTEPFEVKEESISEPNTEAEQASGLKIAVEPITEPKTVVETIEVKEVNASEAKTAVETIEVKEVNASEAKTAVETIEVKEVNASEAESVVETIEVKEVNVSEAETVVETIEVKEVNAFEVKTAVETIEVKEVNASEAKTAVETIEVKEVNASEAESVVETIEVKEVNVSEAETVVETIEVKEVNAFEVKTAVETIEVKEVNASEAETAVETIEAKEVNASEAETAVETIEAKEVNAFEAKTAVETIEVKEVNAFEAKTAVETIEVKEVNASEAKTAVETIEVKEVNASEAESVVETIEVKEVNVSEAETVVETIEVKEVNASKAESVVETIEVKEVNAFEAKTAVETIEVKEVNAFEAKTAVETIEVKEVNASEAKTAVETIEVKKVNASEAETVVETIEVKEVNASEAETVVETIEVKEVNASEAKTVVGTIEVKEELASEPKIAVEPITEPKIVVEPIEVKEELASEPKIAVEPIEVKEESVSEPKTEVDEISEPKITVEPISEPKTPAETIEVSQLTETNEKIKVDSKLVSETIGDKKLTEAVSEIIEENKILDTAQEKTESVSADEIKASEIIEEKKTTELIEQLVSELKKEVEPSDLSLDNNGTELIKDLPEESVIISEIVTQIDNLKDTEIVVESNFKETVVEINTDDNNGFEMQIKTSDGNGNKTITTILAESANFSQNESSQIIVETQKVDEIVKKIDETSNQNIKTEDSISTVVLSGVLSDNQTEIDIETKSNVSIEEVLFEIEKSTEKLAEQEVVKNS
jgi:Ca2+-binding EF-hand superfamily protein